MKIIFVIFVILYYCDPLYCNTIKGKIIEDATGKPISDAQILIKEKKLIQVSDKDGFFQFENLSPSNYTIKIFHFNYEPFIKSVVISSNEDVILNIKLKKRVFELPSIKVIGKRQRPKISSYKIDKKKLQAIAGNMGDVLKSVQSLPGVTQVIGFSSIYIVRGGTPYDSKIYFDRLPILLPFHFGGFISVINSEIIKEINFYASGFGAEYGDCMGSVLEITSEKNNGNFEGKINLNLLTLDSYFNIPLKSGAYIISSYRQSYFHLIAKDFFPDFTVFPYFYDYQIKFNYNLSDRNQLSILLLGSKDKAELKISEKLSQKLKNSLARFENYFHTQGIILKSIFGKKLIVRSILYRNLNFFYNEIENSMLFKIRLITYSISEELSYIFNKFHNINFGVGINYNKCYFKNIYGENATILFYSDIDEYVNEGKEEKSEYNYYFTYLKHQINIFKWNIISGIRYEKKDYTKEHLFSPRILISKKLTSHLKLNFSINKYYQSPQVYHTSGVMGNPDLSSIISYHYVYGIEYKFIKYFKLKTELYHKKFENVIAISANENNETFTNSGKGEANGIEFYLSYNIKEKIWGWISYSYSIAERKWSANSPTVLYYFDKPHIFNLLLSYKINPKFQIGAKFNYTSGIPMEKIIGVKNGSTVNEIFETTRYPAYHRLDLRFDYFFKIFQCDAKVYIEFLNVYNRKNIVEYIYNSDYSNYKNPTKLYDLPFLPFLGIEVRF